jgi:putative ATP-binding cassette transporter
LDTFFLPSTRLEESELVVEAGERVLIAAAPGASKTLLFRALAGLWPWGAGRVLRPPGEAIFYMPRGTPYLPRGSLREVLSYPQKVERYGDEVFAHALQRLGLDRLVPLLDLEQRWDRVLGHDEQIALAFARVLVQAPAWVLIDEALGSLDEELLERVVEVFGQELRHSEILHIGKAGEARDRLFPRSVQLLRGRSVDRPAEASPGAAADRSS